MLIKKINRFLNFFSIHLKRIGRNHDTVINDIIEKSAISELNLTIIDCGAHNGSSIERFRRIYGTGANIFAFEPSNLYFDLIERFEDENTKICNIALSDQNALIDFYQHNSSTGIRLQKKSTRDQNLVLDGVLITLKMSQKSK